MALVRPARPGDEEFLLALTGRLAEFPVPPWRTPGEITAADHAILLSALREPSDASTILVAEEQAGVSAGFVFATLRRDYFTGAPAAHVEVLAVAESAQGRGVARQLMDAAEVWARARGCSNVTLNVFAANTRAQALYERLGYRQETVHYLKPL